MAADKGSDQTQQRGTGEVLTREEAQAVYRTVEDIVVQRWCEEALLD